MAHLAEYFSQLLYIWRGNNSRVVCRHWSFLIGKYNETGRVACLDSVFAQDLGTIRLSELDTSNEPRDMASFEGKVILLVGGASGVGLATAKLLASRGAHLSVADVNADVTTVIAQQIPSTDKVKVTAHQVDITDQSAVQALIVATMKEHGRIDGCANIAGVIGRLNGLNIWETERSQFDFVMGVNAGGLFNLLAAELKPGILPDGASIVNVASILSLRASPKSSPYITSKHAVQGLTKAAAMDAAPRNIRVNCVAP